MNNNILFEVFKDPIDADILYGSINQVLDNGVFKRLDPLIEEKFTMANFNSNHANKSYLSIDVLIQYEMQTNSKVTLHNSLFTIYFFKFQTKSV